MNNELMKKPHLLDTLDSPLVYPPSNDGPTNDPTCELPLNEPPFDESQINEPPSDASSVSTYSNDENETLRLHVAPFHRLEQTPTDRNNSTTRPLPVAVPINQQQDQESLNQSHTGDEDVIDGVVVNDNRKPYKRLEIVLLIVGAIIALFFIAFATRSRRQPESTNEPSFTPSTVKSSSSSPTTEFDYDGYVKMIALQISDEEILNDSTSIQHKIWKLMAKQLPVYVETSLLELNDTRRIAQRYKVGVVGGSLSRFVIEKPDVLLLQSEALDECNFPSFTCNENLELTGMFLANEWATEKGAGTIATEIGTMEHLRHVVFTRSALVGTIPSEIGNLEQLRILDLKNNFLTGSLPTQIGQLQNLELMNVNTNLLRNDIPSEIVNMKNLKYLNLAMNRLSGSVPTELASLDRLESFLLHNNSLKGNVEYVCSKNSSTLEKEIMIRGESDRFTYNFQSEYSVDCKKVECSCCDCA